MSRRYQIYAPDFDRVFEENELSQLLFRDVGLHNGSKLTLREPEKAKSSKPVVQEAEEGDDADMEVVEQEDGDSQVDKASEAEGWGEGGAEGGEDEMIEFEGGEDEIVEMGFAGENFEDGDQPMEEGQPEKK